MVGKVAKAFGKTARELAPYGGYPVLPSEGEGDLFGGRLILPTYCIAVHNAPSTYDARGVGARSSHDFLRPDHHPIQGRPVAAIRAAEVLGAWIEISVSFHVNMFTPT